MLGGINPQQFIISLVALVVAIAIHEFAHAWSALQLGDNTALHQGRVTLNPVAHFDPLGFILLCVLAAGFPGFAWGRPVPVNPYALRGGRRGMALVAVAGPISNILQAAAGSMALRFLPQAGLASEAVLGAISLYVYFNLLLAAFNMLPVPPLDGFNVLMGLVSNYWVSRLEPLRNAGPVLLLLLIFVGGQYIYPLTVEPMFNLFALLVGAPFRI